MVHRIEVGIKNEPALAAKIRNVLRLDVSEAFSLTVYSLDFDPSPAGLNALAKWAYTDKLVEKAAVDQAWVEQYRFKFDAIIEKRFKPGVTDSVGKTAKEVAETVLQKKLDGQEGVFCATQYIFRGKIDRTDAETIATHILGNPLIEQFIIIEKEEFKNGTRFPATVPKVWGGHDARIEKTDLTCLSDGQLVELNKKRQLALNLEELRAIKNHFKAADFLKARKTRGLGSEATDAEMEVFAQTWSEHCKHKEFNAIIEYNDLETGKKQTIDGLFPTFIFDSTNRMSYPWLRSVFKDNAGIVNFNEDYYFVFKVETHNSPSALDPYGGALTGIVGNNRDVAGAGMGGADLWFNQFYYCLGNPHYPGPLLPKTMHPRQIFEGVVAGVKDGGNKCGVPTLNGGLSFDERFMAKPLVYCGTGGLMKKRIAGRDSAVKKVLPGDAAIMLGGRIGKDGIHGATMSSEERKHDTPVTAVQIGDPIVQKKMFDFMQVARDEGWFNAVTDNGAGGLSSSLGEMARLSGGVRFELSKAPLKYPGLQPWEILVSEAQERMSAAVPQEHVDAFLERAKQFDVEATVLGEFTDSGYMEVTYGGKLLVFLDLEFLHEGVPRKHLQAEWRIRPSFEARIPEKTIPEATRLAIGALDSCSKEWIFRQKDHNVKGGTLLPPIGGVDGQVNLPASLIKPVFLDSFEAVATSQGIFPKYADWDAKEAAACAFNEASGRLVALGAQLPDNDTFWAACDNFCVPDSVNSQDNPDGKYKLAQLVRLCQGIHEYALTLGIPLVSGKDSMKNDLVFEKNGKKVRISVPPTVLISVVAKINDYRKTLSIDFKNEGDLLYVVGVTKEELAGSQFLENLGSASHPQVPSVDVKESKTLFEKVSGALRFASSAYFVTKGGLALAVTECALAGGLGATIDLGKVPKKDVTRSDYIWTSETQNRFLISVPTENRILFETAIMGLKYSIVGEVQSVKKLAIKDLDGKTDEISLQELSDAYRKPLQEDLPAVNL